MSDEGHRVTPRKYRLQPSEHAGYTPGQTVVQYYDPDIKRWFDIGDPKSHTEARLHIWQLRNENNPATAALQHHVGGAVERGEAEPITEQPATDLPGGSNP